MLTDAASSSEPTADSTRGRFLSVSEGEADHWRVSGQRIMSQWDQEWSIQLKPVVQKLVDLRLLSTDPFTFREGDLAPSDRFPASISSLVWSESCAEEAQLHDTFAERLGRRQRFPQDIKYSRILCRTLDQVDAATYIESLPSHPLVPASWPINGGASLVASCRIVRVPCVVDQCRQEIQARDLEYW